MSIKLFKIRFIVYGIDFDFYTKVRKTAVT